MEVRGGGEGWSSSAQADLLHLLEESLLLHVPPARVDDDDLVALLLELVDALRRDHRRVRLRVAPVEGDLRLRRVLLQLVKGAGAEGVGAHERALEPLALHHVGVLGARGGLAAPLQPDEHDDVRLLLLGRVRQPARVEHAAELVDDTLLQHLALVDAAGHLLDVHALLHLLS